MQPYRTLFPAMCLACKWVTIVLPVNWKVGLSRGTLPTTLPKVMVVLTTPLPRAVTASANLQPHPPQAGVCNLV